MPDFGIRTAQSEFGKAVEGMKFRHPETGNMVLYVSLPTDEQHRIYEEWQKSQAQEEPSSKPDSSKPDSSKPDSSKPKIGDTITSWEQFEDGLIVQMGSGIWRASERNPDGSIPMSLWDDGTWTQPLWNLTQKAFMGNVEKGHITRAADPEKGAPKQPPQEIPEPPKSWKPVSLDDIYHGDFIVYEHDGRRHMGVVVRIDGPADLKTPANQFWVTLVDPKTGKALDSKQRHSFDARKLEERKAVLVPQHAAPKAPLKAPPKVLTPEEKAELEKKRKEKEEADRKAKEEAEKKRKAAVEQMSKTGKPISKTKEVDEDDVIAFHWKGEVYHGRVIEKKGDTFFILPIDPETGRITSTKYDTFRDFDLRDTDAHKVETEHLPPNPKKKNIREVFESLVRLKEDPEAYFHQPQDSQLVDIAKIKPSKVRLKGVINGNDLLVHAAKGKGGKRDPISLIDNGDGTYTVRDGNSTYTNARLSKWEKIPAIIKTQEEWEEHDRREKERKEKAEKEYRERMKRSPGAGFSEAGPFFFGPASYSKPVSPAPSSTGAPPKLPPWTRKVTSRPAPEDRPAGLTGAPLKSIKELKHGDLFGYRRDGRWYVGRVVSSHMGLVQYRPLHPATGRPMQIKPLDLRTKDLGGKKGLEEPVLLSGYEFPEEGSPEPEPEKKTAALDGIRVVLADLRTAYRSEWREWPGYKTLVDDKSQRGVFPQQTESTNPSRGQSNLDSMWPVAPPQSREKERALPLPSNHDRKRDQKVGPTYYNKNRRTPPRTLSVPGEEYGHPTKYDYNYVRRREGVTALEEEEGDELERVAVLPLPKPNEREKKLGPTYARIVRQWYLRNRPRKKLKQKLKYRTRLKRDPQAKRYRRYYKMYPNRYKRRGRSPFNTPAERTKAWREEQGQKSRATGKSPAELKRDRERRPTQTTRTRKPAPPGRKVYAQVERLAELLELFASNWPVDWSTHVKKTKPPEQLDQNHAPSNPQSTVPRKDPEKQKGESLRAPDLPAKPQPGLQWKIQPPAPGGTQRYVRQNNPTDGSGKVIPMSWYTQEVNNTQALPDGRQDRYLHNNNFDVKVAATLAEILQRCDSKIKLRSQAYTPTLERTDTKNWIWRWRVGDHVVQVQAFRRGRATSLPKLNLRVSCSCPFWRWWGPAHWATREDYQRGQAPGTAAFPVIRDPAHWRPICKHAYAVLEKAKNFFVRPEKSPLKKLSRFSADTEQGIEIVTVLEDMVARVALAHEERLTVRRVVSRYLGEKED